MAMFLQGPPLLTLLRLSAWLQRTVMLNINGIPSAPTFPPLALKQPTVGLNTICTDYGQYV
jgi:hypothetical protein